jgi:hypothetical protein
MQHATIWKKPQIMGNQRTARDVKATYSAKAVANFA